MPHQYFYLRAGECYLLRFAYVGAHAFDYVTDTLPSVDTLE